MSSPLQHQSEAGKNLSGEHLTFENCLDCGSQISSARQIQRPGTDVCDECARVVEGER